MTACKQVQESQKLKQIIELILAVGNYINGGTRRGEAYGIRLNSLAKLNDLRSTDLKKTFCQCDYFWFFRLNISDLAEVVKKQAPHLLNFGEQIAAVTVASKCRSFSCSSWQMLQYHSIRLQMMLLDWKRHSRVSVQLRKVSLLEMIFSTQWSTWVLSIVQWLL